MKIKSNDPIWKDVYSQSKLPASLEGLKEMSTNLWWVWNHEGAKLFGKIDPALWKKTEGNPVQLLQNLSFQRTEEILADKELMAEITKVYADFKAYINVKPDHERYFLLCISQRSDHLISSPTGTPYCLFNSCISFWNCR